MERVQIWRLVVAAIVVGFSFASANAAYTTVQYPGSDPCEPSYAQILGDIYGGTFTGSGTDLGYGMWTVFSNSTVTAHRINDLNGEIETLNIITNGPDDVDQIWTNGTAIVTAEAKHAWLFQSFGWNGGGTGTNYYELVTKVGQVSDPFQISGDFLWGGRPYDDCPYLWWSKNSNNWDSGSDHMVTYKITGLQTNRTVWLVFWEDLPTDNPSDFDFNDFVVEIRAIPEPGSMLLLGLGALALLRKRRT